MNFSSKRWLTVLFILGSLAGCSTIQPSAAVTSKPDPILCPPAALELCDTEQPLLSPSLVEFKAYTKGLIVDYGECRVKQKALATCIDNYTAAHK